MERLKLILNPVDYVFVIFYFIFVVSVGLIMRKKASRNRANFFLSGRSLSWWLLGTSMVATTFSIASPILVAAWSREVGIVKNWEWWVFLFGQMFTTFFFAKLWRRTNVFNDAEFISLRYSGKPAAFLRGFRSIYMGFIMNFIVMGGGLVAAGKVGTIIFGIESEDPDYQLWRWGIALVCGLTALWYSCLSGFAAIIITDFAGFILAISGSILLAVFTCRQPEIGGLGGLVEKIRLAMPEKLDFIPSFQPSMAGIIPLGAVIAYCCVRWWAQVYGGAEPGGQSHVVQRLSSARSEKDALLGTMWFNIAHYAVRPLPWIITGLATIFIFPVEQFTDHEKVYLATMNFLPIGIKGLVLASLFAAFLTTLDTRMNLGTSYFVNDFFKPFISKDKSEHYYIIVSRIVTVVQLVLSFTVLLIAKDIKTLFFIYVGIGSGAGLVYILRFYWWRISAWSEIAAMLAALICLILFRCFIYRSEESFNEHAFEYMFISLILVTVTWLIVTFIAKPTDKQKLKVFFRQVRPAGPLWRPISTELEIEENIKSEDDLKVAFIGWLFSNPMTLGYLFGIGNLLFGRVKAGLIWLTIAVVCTFITVWSIKKITSLSDSTIDALKFQCIELMPNSIRKPAERYGKRTSDVR